MNRPYKKLLLFACILSTYPVLPLTVKAADKAGEPLLIDIRGQGVGQPYPVSGSFVNTAGTEDGAMISPDGNYLFIQTGPWNFTGSQKLAGLCKSYRHSIGYNLNDCQDKSKPETTIVNEVIGTLSPSVRPDFPKGSIANGKIRHAPGFQIPMVANGLATFPTVFYGFKRQPDGSFASPFKIAFDDSKAITAPFGLSVSPNADGGMTFVVAWNNYLNNLGDDKPDIYVGRFMPDRPHSLGTVTYGAELGGDNFKDIQTTLNPVPLPSHKGTQGNPYLFMASESLPTSLWTDDEETSKDISLYILTSGTFPNGKWHKGNLPRLINTKEHERQPFFDGTYLYFMRGSNIVRHKLNIADPKCRENPSSESCWGAEEMILGVRNPANLPSSVIAVGEPSVAQYQGQKILYFVYVYVRDPQRFKEITDVDSNIGWVEIDKR